ncbi:6-phosphogluconolactonase [Aestuariibacter halophilus]|uniref:6-phosphogluconolactonase n=1 Tax=Fluctibacter halophilus TaxID=226011 RepID=A0ABS8G495_9ALTE|nr:6-phosphogluconolactonase [Aestuariibacter halophilus]MCC2615417.1 6-phosphogluconolactonase [Aestuariibacter halophilus]
MTVHQHIFDTAASLNADICKRIVDILQDGIEQHGRASLVVSGGRTPVPLFAALSEQPLAWDKVDVTLADERWVDNNHEASNEKLVREHLLVGRAANANFVPLKTSAEDASDGVSECEQRIAAMQQPFDVLILGMGEDGHTASLFPCSAQLADGLDCDSGRTCIAVTPGNAPHQRMSLTLPALLNSKHIFLHLTGDKKRQVVEQAMASDDVNEMPIRAVLQHADVDLMWAP